MLGAEDAMAEVHCVSTVDGGMPENVYYETAIAHRTLACKTDYSE